MTPTGVQERGRRTFRTIVAITALGALAITAVACSSSKATSAKPPAAQNSTALTSGSTPAPGDAKASGPSAGCGRTPVVAAGTTDDQISSGGMKRHYLMTIPAGYDGTTPLPLVFGLHSLTVDYHVVPAISGFADMQKTQAFIAVSPSGLLGPSGKPYWNAAPVKDNYDLTFLTALLDHLEATLCIDQGKVFSVGMSNGAQMSSLLACRIGNRLAGIAAISGVEFNEPCSGPPVPVLAFHGLKDPIVPYKGGGLNSVTIANMNYYKGDVPPGTATPTGVDESMANWAKRNHCDPTPVETQIASDVRKRIWQNCAAPTILYIVTDGGHGWPGKPQPSFEAMFGHDTTAIDATSLIAQLFFEHKS